MRRAAATVLAAATILLSPVMGGAADSGNPGSNQPGRQEHARREFGDIRFVMGSGQAMKWFEVYVRGSLTGAYHHFEAQEVHASPDGRYFLAISNAPFSSNAFVVLDRDGREIFSSPHNDGTLRYCGSATGNNWHWIDAADPQARFEPVIVDHESGRQEYLQSVTVRGCDGRDMLLGYASPPSEPGSLRR